MGTNHRGWAARAAVFAIAIATGVFFLSLVEPPELVQGPGGPQLVAVHELPDYGDACEPSYVQVSEYRNQFGALGTGSVYAGYQEAGADTVVVDRPPIRQIRDLEPIYGAVGVNPTTNEVILGDANFWSIRVFDRTKDTPPGAPPTTAKRIIQGVNAQVQFINGIYIDPDNGDIYAVETDTGDKVIVFNHDDDGNVAPKREIQIPHRGFSLAVDEESDELYVGVHYPPEIAVFNKDATADDLPIRSIQGESTRLSYVHGTAIDPINKNLFVANWGRISDYSTPGTGRFEDPSISIYPLGADGDAAPTRVIQGDQTQLNWPSQMTFNADSGELYVANDMGDSILVFKDSDDGNVAPTRVIKGDRTGIKNPLGVAIDKENNELWVANMGNSSAVAFPLNADGNVAPLRTIRSGAADKVSLKFGKVEALAYDPMRDVVWVPN